MLTINKEMNKEIKFRCRHCNKPLRNMLDAYTCECKDKKKFELTFWPASRGSRKAKVKTNTKA